MVERGRFEAGKEAFCLCFYSIYFLPWCYPHYCCWHSCCYYYFGKNLRVVLERMGKQEKGWLWGREKGEGMGGPVD